MSDIEKVQLEVSTDQHLDESDKHEAAQLKLDPYGFPLRPQPSDDPFDPLNWNRWYKLFVLFQVAFIAFLDSFTPTGINAAFGLLAKSMDISIVTASYNSTVVLLFTGVAPLILSPICNVYGRRPVFVFSTAVGVAAHFASAAAPTWAGILVSRAFVGIGTSAGIGMGSAIVADLFFMHERGVYMGLYVVFLANGSHLSPIWGGFAARDLGWRWCFWIPGMILAGAWLLILFCLPETLYHRNNKTGQSLQSSQTSWLRLFTFNGASVGKQKLRPGDFTHVFLMLKYPSVLLPILYYGATYTISGILYGITAAAVLGPIYHFDAPRIGLTQGLSTTIGTLLGELLAGPVSDRILNIQTGKHKGDPQIEARLHALWPGVFLCPIGTIIEGLCLQYKTHWIGPAMGMAIGCFGNQIISTNIYTYITDCYKPQSAQVATLINFGRMTMSFNIAFYMIPFAKATSYAISWSIMAIVHVVFFTGILALMWKGREWRERLGPPKFHQDI